MDVAGRIRFFREQKTLTVNKLANLAGISQSFLREIELGRKKPTVDTLSLVCDALNITLADFFDTDSESALRSNDLLKQIYCLTPKQQTLLGDFLRSL